MAQTPQEKAKVLVDKFKEAAKAEIFKGWIYYHKKCALIAVDEILNEFPKGYIGNFEEMRKTYWQQVK